MMLTETEVRRLEGYCCETCKMDTLSERRVDGVFVHDSVNLATVNPDDGICEAQEVRALAVVYRELQAERDELLTRLAQNVDIKCLTQRCEQLRVALEKWGRHFPGCGCSMTCGGQQEHVRRECTCGLDAAKSELCCEERGMTHPCCPTREALQNIIAERTVAASDPGASLDLMRDYAARAVAFPCPCRRLAKLEAVAHAARGALELGKVWAEEHVKDDHRVTLDHQNERELSHLVLALCDALAALDQKPNEE